MEPRLDPLPLVPSPDHPLQDPKERVAFRMLKGLSWPKEQGFPWGTVLDVFLFTALLGIGAAVLYWRDELGISTFGGVFVNSGLTPLVLTTWALLLGSSLFRRQNLALSAGICFSTGYALLNYVGEVELFDPMSLLALLGPAFLELGLVFFISKVFFMAEDSELQVERLEEELEAAKRSPGTGLALSYFYNFLLPTAANWNGVGTNIAMGNDTFTLTDGPFFYVFVPRDLNEIDMKAELRRMQGPGGGAHQGKPVEAPGSSHRPFFSFYLNKDDVNKTCGFGFDIPTVISSCYDRAKRAGSPEAMENVVREIVDFQNALQELVDADPVTRKAIAIVSIPPAPFDAASLAHVARRVV